MEDTGRYGVGTVLLAALGGAAVGVAGALLLAPASGHDSRKKLVGYADTAWDTLGKAPEAIKEAAGKVPEVLKQASHAIGKGRLDGLESPKIPAMK